VALPNVDVVASDLDRTPRPEELPGGLIHAEMLGEAEMIGGRRWANATAEERDRMATDAAVTARVSLARVRSLGFATMADYLAATEDPPALRALPADLQHELDQAAEWTADGWHEMSLGPISAARLGASAGGSIGTRTAADLRHGDPPEQLADPFLTAEGPTVLYGRGGVGKGMLGCWLLGRLVAAGHVVLLIDFEGHEREWGSRLHGLGLSDADLGEIHYRAPFGPDWTAPTGALSAVAGLVRDEAARIEATYLVVDSYSVATSNGDTMGGEQAAREYFGALARIGLPSLTIAHVRGDSGKFPDRPFGSVFVHNLARETWAVERLGEDQPDDDEGDPYQPNVVALELRNKKSNGRAASRPQFVSFTFYADGSIEVNSDRPGGRSLADLAADVLADGPLTLPKLVAAIREDTGLVAHSESMRTVLKRQPQRFVEEPGPRPHRWALR